MPEKELLIRVIEGLRKIRVSGEEDCGIMHDCIYALKEIIKAHDANENARDEQENEICPE